MRRGGKKRSRERRRFFPSGSRGWCFTYSPSTSKGRGHKREKGRGGTGQPSPHQAKQDTMEKGRAPSRQKKEGGGVPLFHTARFFQKKPRQTGSIWVRFKARGVMLKEGGKTRKSTTIQDRPEGGGGFCCSPTRPKREQWAGKKQFGGREGSSFSSSGREERNVILLPRGNGKLGRNIGKEMGTLKILNGKSRGNGRRSGYLRAFVRGIAHLQWKWKKYRELFN